MSNGFMVPGSRSGSYVASKRTEEGSFAYDTARQELGIQKQAALQELGKEYESTIENAYISYLANQRAIGTSAMGQGYKEAYMQAQDEALRAQTAETNLTAASARAELESQIGQAQEAVTEQYKTEVGYLDRALTSMDNYLTYLSSLSKDNKNYWNLPEDELSKLKTEDIYEQLLSAQPQDYTYYNETTGESAAGLPYLEWLDTQLGTSKADTEWREWLYGGGYNDIRKAYESQKSTGQLTKEKYEAEQERLKTEREKAEELAAKESANYQGYYGSAESMTGNDQFGKVTITYKGNTYSAKAGDVAGTISYKLDNLAPNAKKGDIVKYNGKLYLLSSKTLGQKNWLVLTKK